jgi:hypothetical protein
MKTLIVGLCWALAAFGAGKGSCTNAGVKWEIRGTYVDGSTPSAITSDGSIYQDGLSNVQAAIDQCGGTGDAKLVLDPTQRNVFVSFSKPLATTSLTPSQMKSGQTVGCMKICWLFNVRNIIYVPSGGNRANEYEFTTHLAGHGPLNTHLYMMNPSATAVPAVNDAFINMPYTDALLHVHHCPAKFVGTSDYCTADQKEQWFVWPDASVNGTATETGRLVSQTATLEMDAVRPSPAGSGGEFSVPFLFIITALQ